MLSRAFALRPDLGLLLIRALVGVVFVFHGSQKLFGLFGGPGIAGFAGWLESLGFPLPYANAVLAGSAELVGGLALLTGVGLRVLSPALVGTMLVAAFTAHSGFDATKGGMEYPLTLAFVVAGLGLTGAGRYTLAAPFRAATGPAASAGAAAPAPALVAASR